MVCIVEYIIFLFRLCMGFIIVAFILFIEDLHISPFSHLCSHIHSMYT